MTRQPNRCWMSAKQRIVILDFDTPEEAEAWDDAGQPIHLMYAAEIAVFEATTRP